MPTRKFGYTRKLPSGRFQASYVGPDGQRRNAPTTFSSELLARKYLKTQDALIQLGQWSPYPGNGEETPPSPPFGEYCERHISIQTTSRGALLERSTQSLYRQLLRTHLSPFAPLRLNEITEALVSDWWAAAIASGQKTMPSKAYKLLASVMRRAVDEKLIPENPCKVKGAHSATTGKTIHVPSLAEVEKIIAAMNPRYRVMVVVAANTGLRFGEVTALERQDFIPAIRQGQKAFNVSITKAIGTDDGKPYLKGPKSEAGIRVVPLRPEFTALIDEHLENLVSTSPDSLVFPSASGSYLRNDVFANSFGPAIRRAGLSKKVTPHGLRHFFGSEFGRAGANMAELKDTLGDSTAVSVLRYLHSTDRAEELLENFRPAFADSEEQRNLPRSEEDELATRRDSHQLFRQERTDEDTPEPHSGTLF